MSSSKMLNGDFVGHKPSGVTNKGQFKNKVKVLIVDDDKIQRMILKAQLKRLGVVTKEVENGKEAVDLFVEGSIFDLVLMDHDMPIIDGSQATRMLRSMGVLSKIVGMSSHTSSDTINKFIDAGLNEYVTKSMNDEKLVALLNEVSNTF